MTFGKVSGAVKCDDFNQNEENAIANRHTAMASITKAMFLNVNHLPSDVVDLERACFFLMVSFCLLFESEGALSAGDGDFLLPPVLDLVPFVIFHFKFQFHVEKRSGI